MFMFIVYVFILYIASLGCGSFIKEDSKLFTVRPIIGFCTFLGISQLVYYPMQYLKVSSNIVNMATAILLLMAFIYGLIKMKKEDFNFLKSYEFWIILLIVFVVIKIIPGVEAGDDSFYMSLFKDNANIDKINSINPRTGLVGSIDNVYLYQGFYLLMSFFYKIQAHFFSGDISNIFISYRTTMSLFAVIMTSLIFIYIRDNYKNDGNKKVFYIVELLAFFLVAVLEWEHIYWGSFMIFQIFVPLVIILFNNYLENKEYKYALMLVNLGCLSLASSMLFLFLIVEFGFYLYELIVKKEACIKDYYLMLIPSIIYVAFVFNLLIIIPFILVPLILFHFFGEDIDDTLNNHYLRYLVFIVPLIFMILGYYICTDLGYIFKIEVYRVSKITVLYNIVIALFVLFILLKKKITNPSLFVFMIVVFFFFNPLVEPFVSHYMTSTYVYYRLFYITRNPFMVSIIFLSLYEFFKDKNKLNILYTIGLCGLVIYYGSIFVKSTVLENNYDIKYNYLLREDVYSHELGEEVSKIPEGSKVYSVYFAPRIYNDKLITDVARYPEAKENRWDSINRVLYVEEEMTPDLDKYFIQDIKENKYNYIISYNNDKVNRLSDFFEGYYDIIYKNDLFVLIKIKETIWES